MARVGQSSITVAEVEALLATLDATELQRYQTLPQRRELLDELVLGELYAEEARARRIDQGYAYRAKLLYYYEKKMLKALRDQVRSSARLDAKEVEEHFQKHRARFDRSQKRRVAAIELASEGAAKTALAKARQGDARAWAQLVQESGKAQRGRPESLAGYLGEVSAPSHGARHPRVPVEVQEAAFEIDGVGQVHSKVVESAGRFFVVKLLGVKAAKSVELSEVEHVVRESLMEARVKAAEQKLRDDIRRRFPVTVEKDAARLIEAL